MNPRDALIVALDVDNEEKALMLVESLKGSVRYFKIGFELFTSCGPGIVRRINGAGSEVFLDLKFHDIPNTVGKAALSVTRLGVFMFNVHALGGADMMKEAARLAGLEATKLGIAKPKVLAVTILTSMDQNALEKIGIDEAMDKAVIRLAGMAKDAGLDGVVASPSEASLIREKIGRDFLIITPGIRPQGARIGDQKRIATPGGAIKAGADYIVVGRPITEAPDPAGAVQAILKEMGS